MRCSSLPGSRILYRVCWGRFVLLPFRNLFPRLVVSNFKYSFLIINKYIKLNKTSLSVLLQITEKQTAIKMIWLSCHSCNFSFVWSRKLGVVTPKMISFFFFFSKGIEEHLKNKLKLNPQTLILNLDLICNTRHSQTLCFFEITNSSGS